ncbi:MAG: endonuclease/exonuclease/phosphatase family protein, partial [Candidatus Eisenbacteria bacterium]
DRWLWSAERVRWARRLAAGMCRFPTLDALRASRLWSREAARLERFLDTVQTGSPGEGRGAHARPLEQREAHARPLARREGGGDGDGAGGRLRVVHWNILKGLSLDGLTRWLAEHPRLVDPDLLLLNEVDVGMARSGNLHVGAEIAARLNLHWSFLANYFELTKGPGEDSLAPGENRIGLQGVAILSRRPPRRLRRVPLPECFDMFAFHEQRFGGRAALLASFEDGLIVAAVHLEVRHTPACRAAQMRALLEGIEEFAVELERAGQPARAVLIGGDFNTHTFARGSVAASIRGILRILTTPAAALHRQLMEPWRAGREPLFAQLSRCGYGWKELNDRRPTAQERLGNVEELQILPRTLRGPVARLLRLRERRIELRLDWFAGRGLHGVSGDADLEGGEVRTEPRSGARSVSAGEEALRGPRGDLLAETIGNIRAGGLPSDHLPITLEIPSASG